MRAVQGTGGEGSQEDGVATSNRREHIVLGSNLVSTAWLLSLISTALPIACTASTNGTFAPRSRRNLVI